MPAQKHNPDLLVAILNRLVTHPHCEIKSTAREFKISPVTIFNWRAASARDEQADLKEASPFWVMWMDQASYWHRHLILARKLSILRIDERLRDLAVNGTKEFLFRQGGEPIWQVDPQLAADALDPKKWQERHGDRPITDVYKRGPDGELLQAYREVPPNPQLLIKAVSALLPEVYGERVQHDVTVGGVFGSARRRRRRSRSPRRTSRCWPRRPEQVKPPANVLAVAARRRASRNTSASSAASVWSRRRCSTMPTASCLPPQPDVIVVEEFRARSRLHRGGYSASRHIGAIPDPTRLLQSVSVQACAVDVGAGARTGSGSRSAIEARGDRQACACRRGCRRITEDADRGTARDAAGRIRRSRARRDPSRAPYQSVGECHGPHARTQFVNQLRTSAARVPAPRCDRSDQTI